MVLVDQCRGYAVLLSHLSLIAVPAVQSRDTHRSYIVADTDTAVMVQRDQPTALHSSVNCASSSSSQACTCSVDLVVRCQGQTATHVPRFSPEVDRVFAELNMAGANVRNLHPDDFLELRVRRVVLNGNQLGDGLTDYVFSSLGNHLTSLMLGACAIRKLPQRLLVDLTQLEVLHLWNNHIDVIPDSFFVANSELRELSLWGNRLMTIRNRTFSSLVQLRLLDLERNRITTLEHGTLSHTRGALQVLRLSNNHISALSDLSFTDLHQLRILTLASNRLSFIDARSFVGLHQLQTLCIANNRIQYLADGAFQHLLRLRRLDLSGNRLDRVWAGTFVGLNSLTSVDLSRNRLSRLPEATFSQSHALRRLILDDNRLSTLGRCSLSSCSKIRSISLIGNVMECDCRLVWIGRLDAAATTISGNCVQGGNSGQHELILPVHKTFSYVDYRFCSLDDIYYPCLL